MPSTSARLRAAWHGKVSEDPSGANDGDWWYNTDEDEFRGYAGGGVVTFETTDPDGDGGDNGEE